MPVKPPTLLFGVVPESTDPKLIAQAKHQQ